MRIAAIMMVFLALTLIGTLASDGMIKRSLKPKRVYYCKCGKVFNINRGPFGCPRCHGANGAAIEINDWI